MLFLRLDLEEWLSVSTLENTQVMLVDLAM